MMLLTTILACHGPGHDKTLFDACITSIELACECESLTCDALDPQGCCVSDAEAEQWCMEYDPRY